MSSLDREDSDCQGNRNNSLGNTGILLLRFDQPFLDLSWGPHDPTSDQEGVFLLHRKLKRIFLQIKGSQKSDVKSNERVGLVIGPRGLTFDQVDGLRRQLAHFT